MKVFGTSPAVRAMMRILVAVLAALLLGFLITCLVSKYPFNAYWVFLIGPLSRLNRVGDWLEESISLIFLGLAVSIAFKAKLFSLGAEGQMAFGALVSGVIALFVPLPLFLRIPLALLAAVVIGFLWGAVPGYLKAYMNANEIVSTLMLNAIALRLYDYFLIFHIKPPGAGYNQSDPFPQAGSLPAFLPPLPFWDETRLLLTNQMNLTIMLYIAVAAFLIMYYIMARTPFGYELRMVGENIKFALYGGINTKRTIVMVFAISGIFAGLAGAHLSLGVHQRLIANITIGLGFEGIVVAIMARNNPLLVPLAALAYGYLRAGADIMERSSDVPREMILIVQAVIILLVTAEYVLPIVRQKMVRSDTSNPTEGGLHAA